MIALNDILYKVNIEVVKGSPAVAITDLHFDSRKVALNDVFVAIRGVQVDGHNYIKKAIDQGAIAIVCEALPENTINGVTYVLVKDSQKALATMAANFYDNPSGKLKLVGVTGTNGKTTVTSLLYQLFKSAGYKTGLISTVKVCIDEEIIPATHTTPNPLALQEHLAKMIDAGVDYCFMEVSSHGIHQKRIEGLQFEGGVFTNLTHDHLDYHKTFAEYRDVKKSFFDGLSRSAFALTNADDKNGAIMLQNSRAKKRNYGVKSFADYRANILENSFQGMLLRLNDQEVWTKLLGQFNASNLIAVYAVAIELGLEEEEVLRLISTLESVDGRFEYLVSDSNINVIIDFAHTPDALKNVLETINGIRTHNETLLTVVGCGGDRDREKRPKMGNIVSQLSDQVVFTNDNPRSEEPSAIIEEMESGVSAENYKKTLVVTDRKQAIKTAITMAKPHDIILVAGKGHEDYQEIKGEKFPFNDMEVVQELLKKLS